MVEWYYSRGSAVNCGESRNANGERVGHPPSRTSVQGSFCHSPQETDAPSSILLFNSTGQILCQLRI